jgi:sulfatase maturation enzyme AslB (radical SAM superfamily)
MDWKDLLHRGFFPVHREGLKKVAMLVIRVLEVKAQVSMLQKFPNLIDQSQVFLEPTNHCNLHCKMCYRGARKVRSMDCSLFTRLIDEMLLLETSV